MKDEHLWESYPWGKAFLQEESQLAAAFFEKIFGYYILEYNPFQTQALSQSARFRTKVSLWAPTLKSEPDRNAQCRFANMSQVVEAMSFTGNFSHRILSQKNALPFSENSLDCVILPHPLEDQSLLLQCFSEIWTVLRPEGTLILTTFNRWSLLNFYRKYFGITALSTEPFFTCRQLTKLLDKNGFSIEALRYCGYALPFRFVQRYAKLNLYYISLLKLAWPSLAGVQMIVAKKRLHTLTPLKIQRENLKKAPGLQECA